MRDHDGGASSERIFKCFLDGRLGFRIEMRSGLVKDDDSGCFQEKTGDGKALFLATREAIATFADHRVEALGKGGNERQDLRRTQRFDKFLLGSPGFGIQKIGTDRVVKQVGFLGNRAYELMERSERGIPDVKCEQQGAVLRN